MKKVKIYGWTALAGGTRVGRIMYQKRLYMKQTMVTKLKDGDPQGK